MYRNDRAKAAPCSDPDIVTVSYTHSVDIDALIWSIPRQVCIEPDSYAFISKNCLYLLYSFTYSVSPHILSWYHVTYIEQ